MKTTFKTSVQVQSPKFTVIAGSGLTRISNTMKLQDGLASSSVGFEIKKEDVPHLIEILKKSMDDLESAEQRLNSSV